MKIAFCIPGKEFSQRFLYSWTNLIQFMPPSWEWHFFTGYICSVSYNRQAILERANMFRPTHYMWNDSDQVFNHHHFIDLVAHDLPIVSGLYHRSTSGFEGREELGDKFSCSKMDGRTLTEEDIETMNKQFININIKKFQLGNK